MYIDTRKKEKIIELVATEDCTAEHRPKLFNGLKVPEIYSILVYIHKQDVAVCFKSVSILECRSLDEKKGTNMEIRFIKRPQMLQPFLYNFFRASCDTKNMTSPLVH